MKRNRSRLLFLALAGAALNCSDSTANNTASDDLAVNIEQPTATVAAGGTTTINLTIQRLRGFADTVTLTAEGMPNGVTVTFSPPELGNTVPQSVATITAAPTAVAGVATITIRATGTGVTPGSSTLSLTVTSTVSAGYTMVASPPALSINRGASDVTAISIVRAPGFTDAVTLQVTGLPPGIIATISPTTVPGNTATLSLTVGAAVVAGTYTGTIMGQVPGLPDQFATVQLTVLVPAGGS